MPLTEAKVRNAKPREKTFKVYDSGGLYLEVSPTGGKWWRLKYRIDGKENRLSLGVYPEVGLSKARKRRDDERALLADHIDPSRHRKAQKSARALNAANTFEQVAREWFAKFSPGWVQAHAKRKIRLLERDVFPHIGNLPIAEVTASELLRVLQRIEARGALVMARRALVYSAQVFRYAVLTERAKADPSGALRGALSPVKNEHFAATTEPVRLAPILRMLDGYEGTLTVRCALRIMPLVFVRPGELRQSEWAQIDLDAAEWRFTVSKTN